MIGTQISGNSKIALENWLDMENTACILTIQARNDALIFF